MAGVGVLPEAAEPAEPGCAELWAGQRALRERRRGARARLPARTGPGAPGHRCDGQGDAQPALARRPPAHLKGGRRRLPLVAPHSQPTRQARPRIEAPHRPQ